MSIANGSAEPVASAITYDTDDGSAAESTLELKLSAGARVAQNFHTLFKILQHIPAPGIFTLQRTCKAFRNHIDGKYSHTPTSYRLALSPGLGSSKHLTMSLGQTNTDADGLRFSFVRQATLTRSCRGVRFLKVMLDVDAAYEAM